MGAVRVGGLGVGVALRTGDLLGRLVVDLAIDVGVAVHAGQQCTMRGVPQPRSIHVRLEADRLSIHILGERVVTVTVEAVGVFELLRGFRGRNQDNQQDYKCTYRKKPAGVHGNQETPSNSLP